MGTELLIKFIGLDLVSRVAERAGNSIDRMENRIKRSGIASAQSLIASGIAATTFGVSLLAIAGGLTAIAGRSVETAAQFRSDMTMVVTHAGLGQAEIAKLVAKMGEISPAMKSEVIRQQVNQLTDDLMKMAPAVGFGPGALVKAFYHVQSASTSLGQDFQSLAGRESILYESAKLAAIGHSDLTDTTNTVISVLAAYHDKVKSASDAAAQLNAIVGNGNVTMQQFDSAMRGGLLPIAARFGVSLASLGAAFGTLTDEGYGASQAATYLRSAIIQMTTPSGPAAKALESIGLAGDVVAKKMGYWNEVLHRAGISQTVVAEKLRESGSLSYVLSNVLMPALVKSGLNAEQSSALIAKAFGGIRSGAGIQGLADNLGALADKEGLITKSTQEWADTWQYFKANDPAFVLKQLQAGFQVLSNTIGNALMPAFLALANFLGPLVQRLNQWIKGHQELVRIIAIGAIALTSLLGIVLLIAGGMLIVGGAFGIVVGAIKELGALMLGTGKHVGLLVRVWGALRAPFIAFVELFGRLSVIPGMVKRVLPALDELFMGAMRLLRPLGEIPGLFIRMGGPMRAVWGALRLIIGALTEFTVAPLLALAGLKFENIERLGSIFMRGFAGLGPAMMGGLRALPGLIMGLGPMILGGLSGIGPMILGGLGAAFTTLGPILLVVAAAAAVFAVAAVLIHDHWGQITHLMERAVKIIGDVAGVLLRTGDPGKALATLLKDLGIHGGQAGAIMKVFHQVMGLVNKVVQSAVDMARRFIGALVQNLSHVHGMNQAIGYLKVAFVVLLAVLYVIGSFLAGLLGGVFQGLLQFFSVAIPGAIQIAIDIINGWGAIFQTIIHIVTGVFKIVQDLIHGNWKQAWKDAGELVSKLKEDVVLILNRLVTLVKDIFATLWNAILLTTLSFVEGFVGALANIPGPVGDQFKKAQSAMQGVLEKMKGAAIQEGSTVGANLSDGIAAGITSHTWGIQHAAREALHEAKEAADKGIDAGSPSRLFRNTTGRWIGQGIALGITDTTTGIKAAASSAVIGAHQASTARVAATPGSGSSGGDMDPVVQLLRELVTEVKQQGRSNSRRPSGTDSSNLLDPVLKQLSERAERGRRVGMRAVFS